ncbi:putative 3,4-dihydroxy-2-butanone kinase [Syzygium oleosum]|uniref:putative 3,4-dihydroxy-2-butanone kinase n=1 Tax=Syzygium oleosum TaxID=219896 RepID=UPI0024BAE7FF|nr:putative 3,4-dihydroxy-2-butanone kinase [Syzygium oleosum]
MWCLFEVFYTGRHTGSLPIRGEASTKAMLHEDRFLLLLQHRRLSRDQHFAKPAFETETTEFRSCEVAGAAAAAGLSLADVAAEAKCASEVMGTMGVALSVCTLPGQVTSDRLGPEKMEVGVGIRGEPGAAVVDLQQVNAIITRVLNQILSTETGYVPITRGDRVVLMVNGLGATPVMEIMIAAGKAVPKLQLEHGLAVDRVYTGSFMTSLDMAGFSITIMKSDKSILQRLDAVTKAPNWACCC